MFKQKKALLALMAGMLLVLVIVAVYIPATKNKVPDVLTTTIDPIHKTINDSDVAFADSPSLLDDPTFNHVENFLIDNVASVNNAINPTVKYVHITSGLRKEQIAEKFGQALDWPASEKNKFANLDHPQGLDNAEGYYYPGTYTVYKGEDSSSVSQKMFDNFQKEIEARYSQTTAKTVSMETALKIASLIEREAAGQSDMRLISGIIWNRMFSGMNLEIDATLQYAKGTEHNGWWPQVLPKDKYINSPYNTYKYNGFPPTPIANPALASVYAALNPQKTNCLFYLHDSHRRIHCSKTYEEHKKNIALYY